MLKYENKLLEYIEGLDVSFPVFADRNDTESSISLASMPGSRTIRTYYDGIKDKQLNHFIQIKAKDSERDKALEALQRIADALAELEEMEDDVFELNKIIVSNEPFAMNADNDFVYFRFSIQSQITVF